MNILVLGSGGREHALCWKIKQSEKCQNLYCIPGNAGIQQIAHTLAYKIDDTKALISVLIDKKIDMLVIGPEQPLVMGWVDQIEKIPQLKHLKIIGPKKEGAQLEGSKYFAKQFMQKYGIPTAKAMLVNRNNLEEGLRYLENIPPPFVLKADGLAAGKGVILTQSLSEAKKTLSEMIVQEKFGEASQNVLIESFLSGTEMSFFVLTDGESYKILPEAKDYKRINNNDQGPNTGGMGAISPVILATPSFKEKVENQIIIPTLEGLKKENIPYKGFIFFGIISVNGDPFVIEYNVRLGDPETQAILPRIKTDFLELLIATADATLEKTAIELEECTAATVVCVAKGYPGPYEKNIKIHNLNPDDVWVFHAGTATHDNKEILTNGGRVLGVVGVDNTLKKATEKAQKGAHFIQFQGKHFRTDIGSDLMKLGQ